MEADHEENSAQAETDTVGSDESDRSAVFQKVAGAMFLTQLTMVSRQGRRANSA